MKFNCIAVVFLFIHMLSCSKEELTLSNDSNQTNTGDTTSVDTIKMIPAFPKIGSKWITKGQYGWSQKETHVWESTMTYMKDTIIAMPDSNMINQNQNYHLIENDYCVKITGPYTPTTGYRTVSNFAIRIENGRWYTLYFYQNNVNHEQVNIDFNLSIGDRFGDLYEVVNVDSIVLDNYKAKRITLHNEYLFEELHWIEGLGSTYGPHLNMHLDYITDLERVRRFESELIWE